MKNTIRFALLSVILLATLPRAAAQDYSKEVAAFTQTFTRHYNLGDASGLKGLFWSEAVRADPDGNTFEGAAAIGTQYAGFFQAFTAQVDLRVVKITALPDNQMIVSGTYTVQATEKVTGDAILQSGKYLNTLVKKDGAWKIGRMVLAAGE